MSLLSSSVFLSPFFPSDQIHLFASMLDWLFTSLLSFCWQDQPITSPPFTSLDLSFDLSLFLLLSPSSPWPLLQKAARADGNKTSSNQCVEWISFEDAFLRCCVDSFVLEKKWGRRAVSECQGMVVIACVCVSGVMLKKVNAIIQGCCYLTLRYPLRITF